MSQFRMYVPAKPLYVEDYTTKLTTYNICSHSLSPACIIPLLVYTCSCTCRGKNGLPKLAFPGTYFTAEYGLPLIWTRGISWGVSKVSGSYSGLSVQQHTIYSSIILGRMQHSNFVTNFHFECCIRPLRCTDNDRYRLL